MTSAATEITAAAEKRGTQRIASGQRPSVASRSAMTTNASPPTHTHAAATWTTSRTNDAFPLTDAWPESAGIMMSPAAGKSAASS